jgi:hypothetical protein
MKIYLEWLEIPCIGIIVDFWNYLVFRIWMHKKYSLSVHVKASKRLGSDNRKSSNCLMTHKYRRCTIVLLINKSVEPNEEQKVLTSGFDQGFTVNTSKWVFKGIW